MVRRVIEHTRDRIMGFELGEPKRICPDCVHKALLKYDAGMDGGRYINFCPYCGKDISEEVQDKWSYSNS